MSEIKKNNGSSSSLEPYIPSQCCPSFSTLSSVAAHCSEECDQGKPA